MDGATPNEVLLAAARSDNEESLLEAVVNNADINCQDGAGDTRTLPYIFFAEINIDLTITVAALHLAVKNRSFDCIEHILSHDNCDVDPLNRLSGKTPLHYAVELEDGDERVSIVESLLDAGANVTIKDKNGDTVLDILRPNDTKVRTLLRRAQAYRKIDDRDIAKDDDGELPGELPPGSDSE